MANVVEKLWGMINNIGVKNDQEYDEEDVDVVDYEEPDYEEEEPEETGVRALFSRRPAAISMIKANRGNLFFPRKTEESGIPVR